MADVYVKSDAEGMALAYEQALKSFNEGGVPIGAALVAKDGKLLGVGHNRRVQSGSAIHHGETSALEASGRLHASVYRGATMYTTLSPCSMCTGACLLYNIGRVVLGENDTFVGGESYLQANGVEVVNLRDEKCKELMTKFIEQKPEVWNEDIGEVEGGKREQGLTH